MTDKAAAAGRVVVLNVDDYEAGRYATSRVLRQGGYEVIEAGSGAEALAMAERRPDLIVLDVNLPDIDGFEVCRRLKLAPETSGIPVLYLSAAYRGPEYRVQGLEVGADGYLTQPVDGRELIATVNALLRAREVREAVKASEKRFRTLMTATTDIIWTTDAAGMPAGDLWDWSEFTGQAPEEVAGLGWLDALHPDDRAHAAAAWREAEASRSFYEVEYRLRRKSGDYRRMRVRALPILDAEGRLLEWVGAATDVTEQRVGEEALARRALQLRELAEASLSISSARSMEEMLKVIADRARILIGAHQSLVTLAPDGDWEEETSESSLSAKYADLEGGATPPDGTGIYALAKETNRAIRMTQEELVRHPAWPGSTAAEGRRPPLRGWLAAPLVARSGRGLGLIQLSDRVEGEFSEEDEGILLQLAQIASIAIENIHLLEETQEANRAKSDFLATMSHELRTPLNAMVGYTDLLLMGVPVAIPETSQAHVERIRAAAVHLTQLIEEVLTHARIEAGRDELHVEEVDLAALVADVASMVEPLARPKGLRFEADASGVAAPVRTDPQKLRQILVNLLGNAIKFTERGEVALTARQEDGQLVIRVRDTGIGIPRSYLQKIFEPFWQVDGTKTRRAGGTGLGLGVVRQLARRLGGSVLVESEEGKGSVFTIRLPLDFAGQYSAADDGSNPPPP